VLSIATEYDVSVDSIVELNQLRKLGGALTPGMSLIIPQPTPNPAVLIFQWPLDSHYLRGLDYTAEHPGIDVGRAAW
jgi:hypothetical protein